MNDDPLAGIAEQVPDRAPLTKRGVDGQFAIRVMIASHELEDAVFAGVLAGHERGPGDGGNRRKGGFEIRPRASGDQPRDVREVALLNQRIEHIEGGAVESNDQEFVAHTLG